MERKRLIVIVLVFTFFLWVFLPLFAEDCMQCFVGRPDPSMEYYLVNGNAPVGSWPGEDCISFDPEEIEVRHVGGRWKIAENNHWIMDFGDKRNEALQAHRLIKRYGFTYVCFVGRPKPSMKYFRGSPKAAAFKPVTTDESQMAVRETAVHPVALRKKLLSNVPHLRNAQNEVEGLRKQMGGQSYSSARIERVYDTVQEVAIPAVASLKAAARHLREQEKGAGASEGPGLSSDELNAAIEKIESDMSQMQDDAEDASMDLQNSMAKQQQLFQLMSNILKMLHDSSMAAIRNIR